MASLSALVIGVCSSAGVPDNGGGALRSAADQLLGSRGLGPSAGREQGRRATAQGIQIVRLEHKRSIKGDERVLRLPR